MYNKEVHLSKGIVKAVCSALPAECVSPNGVSSLCEVLSVRSETTKYLKRLNTGAIVTRSTSYSS